MKNNSNSAAPTSGHLLDELRALMVEAEKMIGNTQGEPDPELLGALRARFGAAQESLSALYGSARQKVIQGARDTDEAVRANPYQSIAIAAGLGLLAGVLIGRRTNN